MWHSLLLTDDLKPTNVFSSLVVYRLSIFMYDLTEIISVRGPFWVWYEICHVFTVSLTINRFLSDQAVTKTYEYFEIFYHSLSHQ